MPDNIGEKKKEMFKPQEFNDNQFYKIKDFSDLEKSETTEIYQNNKQKNFEINNVKQNELRNQFSTPVASLDSMEREKYFNIEGILEEDLNDIYVKLSPQDQLKFKRKGEETAITIFRMVYYKTKVKIKKIINLIRKWLKLIPGINKYFLEQEVKIKTDKIAAIAIKEGKKIEF